MCEENCPYSGHRPVHVPDIRQGPEYLIPQLQYHDHEVLLFIKPMTYEKKYSDCGICLNECLAPEEYCHMTEDHISTYEIESSLKTFKPFNKTFNKSFGCWNILGLHLIFWQLSYKNTKRCAQWPTSPCHIPPKDKALLIRIEQAS